MTTQIKVWIALTITAFCVIGAVWQIANHRGLKSRGRRRMKELIPPVGSRKADKRKLTSMESKMFHQAQDMLSRGKIASAARVLEQINMHREAIQALEDHGLIHEAAKILMRMQRHHRAGVIYARHGMWNYAAQCFRLANMPLEVAKCARESGDHQLAAEYFEKAERYEDAAASYEALNELENAARLYSKSERIEKALEIFNLIGLDIENLSSKNILESDLSQIIEFVSQGKQLKDGSNGPGLQNIISHNDKCVRVILSLIERGLIRQGKELYLKAKIDIGPMMMADVSLQGSSAGNLSELFMQAKQYRYAGMLYERMSSFSKAGDAFEKAEDFDRAIYCFERAGMDGKARIMRDDLRKRPASHQSKEKNAQFDLNNISESKPLSDQAIRQESDDFPSSNHANQFGGEQATKIMNQEFSQSEVAISPPPPPPPPKLHETTPPEKSRPSFSLSEIMQTDSFDSEENTGQNDDSAQIDDKKQDQGDSIIRVPFGNTEPHDDPQLQEHFNNAKFFVEFDLEQKSRLWELGSTQSFNTGDVILDYKDEPRGIYVIIFGTVQCFRKSSNADVYIDQMNIAETFGELWLLTDMPSTVKFVAANPSKIRVIDRTTFNEFLDKDGTIARKVYKRFTNRLLKRLLTPQHDIKKSKVS